MSVFSEMAARLNAGSAARYNGGSAPSSGSGSRLDHALDRVAAAEQELDNAREAARQAARAEGKPTSNLFAKSSYIARSTGVRWADAAYERACKQITDMQLRAAGLDPEKVCAQVDESLERDRAAARARKTRRKAIMRDAGYFDALDAGDYETAGRIAAEMHDTLTRLDAHFMPREFMERQREHSAERNSRRMGQQILAAGRKAHAPVADSEVPEPTGLAKRIVEAGRRARTPTGEHEND